MLDKRLWLSVVFPAAVPLLLAALGHTLIPAPNFDLMASCLTLLSAALYLRQLHYYWGPASDILSEVRRFRRLVWLLPPLAIASFLAGQHFYYGQVGSEGIWIALLIIGFALFIFLTLLLQVLRLSPAITVKKFRLGFAGMIILLSLFLKFLFDLQTIIYFLLGVWMLGFEECTQISTREKRKLGLACIIPFVFLLVFNLARTETGAADDNYHHGLLFMDIFSRISPLAFLLLVGLKKILWASVLVLAGKILLRPLADWLKLSLRIRTKLLLSYALSSIIPVLLLLVILFFGIVFLFAGYHQRFINALIISKANALLVILDHESADELNPENERLNLRLSAEAISALIFEARADSQVVYVGALGTPAPTPIQADTMIARLGIENFAGLARMGDSLYWTQWTKTDGRIVGLLRPFARSDLLQMKKQCGIDLAISPGGITFSETEKSSTWRKGHVEISASGFAADLDTVGTWMDTYGPSRPEKIRLSFPLWVYVPSLKFAPENGLTKTNIVFWLWPSWRALFGSLFAPEYFINKFYLMLFAILALLLGIVLILVALVGFGLAGGITRSISQLRQATQQLRSGDLNVNIQLKNRDELGDLAASFNLMVADVKRMLAEVKEKERLEGELEAARSIQLKLLPEKVPELPGYEIAAASLPAKQVGGDYYDFISLPPQSLGIVIGDVSGKGMPAALLMANLQASLHALMEAQHSPAELISRLNRALHTNTSPHMFATFFFGVLETESGQLRYVNAGHNHPLVCSDGRAERLATGGLPLGVLADTVYSEGTLSLNRGEMLILFSDGIVEAMNGDEQEFGEDRLIRLLEGCSGQPAEAILQSVLKEVEAFAGTPQDDVTMVVIKRSQESGVRSQKKKDGEWRAVRRGGRPYISP